MFYCSNLTLLCSGVPPVSPLKISFLVLLARIKLRAFPYVFFLSPSKDVPLYDKTLRSMWFSIFIVLWLQLFYILRENALIVALLVVFYGGVSLGKQSSKGFEANSAWTFGRILPSVRKFFFRANWELFPMFSPKLSKYVLLTDNMFWFVWFSMFL